MYRYNFSAKVWLVLLLFIYETGSLVKSQAKKVFAIESGAYYQNHMEESVSSDDAMSSLSFAYNLLAQNEYSDGEQAAVPKPDNYGEVQRKVEKIFLAYKSKDINLGIFELEPYRNYCLNDTHFVKASRGMALLFSYYYLLRLDFLGQSHYRFSYAYQEELKFKDMLMGMSFAQITKYFGEYTDKVNHDDHEDIHSFLRELDEAHDRFAKLVNRRVIASLNSAGPLSAQDFYDLGFPAHRNNCFTDKLSLSKVVVKGNQYAYSVNWDLYLYSFWLRRYNDRTIGTVDKILDFVLRSL